MKLNVGLAAALAGCAAAAQQAAEVFILPSREIAAASTPTVPRSIARLLLLQRLAPAGKGPSINDIPTDAIAPEDVVEMMNTFGKEAPLLFGEDITVPSQLVVMLEGLTEEQMKNLGEAMGSKPAFEIIDPPSSSAHDKLIRNDIYNAGVTNEHKCSIKEVMNPFAENCWSGKSTVAKYNVQKTPDVLDDLSKGASALASLAKSGEMETTIVVFPASTNTKPKNWSDGPQELRRRQAEQVMTAWGDEPEESEPTFSPVEGEMHIFYASSAQVPSCFKSEDSCVTGTGNCSGHGSCVNRYANSDGSDGKETCYACHCLATVNDQGSLTHWAGKTCAKKDVSVPFWLFAGFTLLMLGILTLAIQMLFSVGEEKLPGVIGAGVSKSK